MKKLLSLSLLLLSLHTFAQKIRFTNSTNQWTTLSFTADAHPMEHVYHYTTDSVIGGVVYKNIALDRFYYSCPGSGPCTTSSDGGKGGLVREDTLTGFVYYFDTSEHLLYNYNMHVGDSISYRSIFSPVFYTDTVASIDSTLINGVYHKIFNMVGKNGPRSYTVLEGVGCTNAPLFPVYLFACFEYGESLVCFSHNGVHPAARAPINSCAPFATMCCPYSYFPDFNNSIGCATLLSTAQTITTVTTYSISPNPAFAELSITAHQPFTENTTISVYDFTGRIVYQSKAEASRESISIATTYWSSGICLVTIQNQNGIVHKDKIVVGR